MKKNFIVLFLKKICSILEILAFFSQLLQSHIVLALINLHSLLILKSILFYFWQVVSL